MRILLVLIQYIALLIIVGGAVSHTVDIRYPVPVNMKVLQPSVGTTYIHPIPSLVQPFLLVGTNPVIKVTGLPADAGGEGRVCPNHASTPNAQQQPCFVLYALIYFDQSLLGPDREKWSAIVLHVPVRLSILIMGLAAYIFVACYFWRRLARKPIDHVVAAGAVLSIFGGGLLIAALLGSVVGDRDVTIGDKAAYGPLELDYPAFVNQSKRLAGEDGLTYAVRLQSSISRAIIETPTATSRFEVSFLAHWPLRILADISPVFLDYVYWDPYRTIQRGRALCGPVSSAFVGIARDNGINARMIMLNGHIVATAEVRPGVWHVFDSDVGVHIPHDLRSIEENPRLAEAEYEKLPFWQDLSPSLREFIISAYKTKSDNVIDANGRVSYHSGFKFAGMGQAELEPLLDRVRFILPAGVLTLGLIGILAGLFVQRRRRSLSVTA